MDGTAATPQPYVCAHDQTEGVVTAQVFGFVYSARDGGGVACRDPFWRNVDAHLEGVRLTAKLEPLLECGAIADRLQCATHRARGAFGGVDAETSCHGTTLLRVGPLIIPVIDAECPCLIRQDGGRTSGRRPQITAWNREIHRGGSHGAQVALGLGGIGRQQGHWITCSMVYPLHHAA